MKLEIKRRSSELMTPILQSPECEKKSQEDF